MTERRSSESSHRLSVKRGAKLLSGSSKPPNKVVTPPKAAISPPNAKKDDKHRRKNPLNDILGHRSAGIDSNDTPRVGPGREPQQGVRATQPGHRVPAVTMTQRVTELERELSMAKEEQHGLRRNLGNIREQRKAHQGTIEGLRQELSKTPMESVTQAVQCENHELRYQLEQLQDQLSAQEMLPSRIQAELDDLRLRLHATEKESQERLQQLLSLKSSISSLTRIDTQITDSSLADSFSQLANRVREWTISNLRRTKLNFDNIPKESVNAVTSICPDYERAAATDKIGFYQAIVGSAVTQILREPLMVGLSHIQAGPLAAVMQCAQVIEGTGSSTEYNEWRRATLRALENSETKHELLKAREGFLHQLAANIGYLFFTLTSVNLTLGAQSTLFDILNSTADLQRILALQKARYRVLFFNHDIERLFNFDDRMMEPVNDLDDAMHEDNDARARRTCLFCIFPCLEKNGNEWGEHAETVNVLFRARVCCGVG